MSRVKLKRGQQKKFLNRIAKYFNFDWQKIAKISNVCERSLRDWRREKYNISYEALLKLHNVSHIPAPPIIKVLPEYWSAKKASRLGAIRRNELYGNPGTPEGRRKGGITTVRKFRENPEFAKNLRFKLRIPISIPKHSARLSEFFGIMLGDGYIKSNKTQIGVSFNFEIDYEYAKYIQGLIKKLFNLNASIIKDNNDKSGVVLASNKNLVEFLIREGLKRGNKVTNQVDVPKWIISVREYRYACLRGLLDTDGSFYSYSHRVNGKIYNNYALDFTNHSFPLLRSVENIFRNDLRCYPSLRKYKVVVHKRQDIEHYISTIGSSNQRIMENFYNSGIS